MTNSEIEKVKTQAEIRKKLRLIKNRAQCRQEAYTTLQSLLKSAEFNSEGIAIGTLRVDNSSMISLFPRLITKNLIIYLRSDRSVSLSRVEIIVSINI